MKLLIFGARGQLGTALARESRRREIDAIPAGRREADITDMVAVRRMVDAAAPDIVVNAAAYTAVDKAETDAATAFAVNCDGAGNVAAACAAAGIALVQISSDYVFDGTGTRPYTEEDPVSPIGIYGRSKADGEAAVRTAVAEHLILRTSWLFGADGHNFVSTMLRLGEKQDSIRVVSDQVGCPTCADDLAAAVTTMAARVIAGPPALWGTYHFCNCGTATWHGLAEKIFELARGRCPLQVDRLVAVTTAEFAAPAPRPAYSVLACDKIRRRFGISPRPWQEALAETLARILAEKDSGRQTGALH